jgi:hypothetical protein
LVIDVRFEFNLARWKAVAIFAGVLLSSCSWVELRHRAPAPVERLGGAGYDSSSLEASGAQVDRLGPITITSSTNYLVGTDHRHAAPFGMIDRVRIGRTGRMLVEISRQGNACAHLTLPDNGFLVAFLKMYDDTRIIIPSGTLEVKLVPPGMGINEISRTISVIGNVGLVYYFRCDAVHSDGDFGRALLSVAHELAHASLQSRGKPDDENLGSGAESCFVRALDSEDPHVATFLSERRRINMFEERLDRRMGYFAGAAADSEASCEAWFRAMSQP